MTVLYRCSIVLICITVIGLYGIQNIIPRLPYSQNNLGISEQTTISLLCALMELTLRNPENTRYNNNMYNATFKRN